MSPMMSLQCILVVQEDQDPELDDDEEEEEEVRGKKLTRERRLLRTCYGGK